MIEGRDLTKIYKTPGSEVVVFENLDLSVERGKLVSIIGPSGAGKSTLLHLFGGLDTPTRGEVIFQNRNIFEWPAQELARFRNRHVGFVFQFHHLLPEFTALENAGMPMRVARRDGRERDGRATALLERVGLGERLTHKPGMLSGGEAQRVAIARALVMDPSVLLADEPTGDLDEHTAESLHDLLREMHRERGLTSIIATHNPRLAAACDRVLRLEDGKLREAR